MRRVDLERVVKLHCELLTGLLTLLGEKIIEIFYKTALLFPYNFGMVSYEGNILNGFIFGTICRGNLYRDVLLTNFFSISINILIEIIKRPKIFNYLVKFIVEETKGKKNKCSTELVYIAVSKEKQNKGIGKQLMSEFNQYLIKQGINHYELSVDADNQSAIDFYEKLGFQFKCKYREFGVDRYRYFYEIRSGEKQNTLDD